MIPTSGRREASELAYQAAKEAKTTVPLELEPSLEVFKHWRLIENRFPYDIVFRTHHMLLPKRAGVSHRWDLNKEEKDELEQLIKEFIYPVYDLWFENYPKRRSVMGMYHLHLASYHNSREEMEL